MELTLCYSKREHAIMMSTHELKFFLQTSLNYDRLMRALNWYASRHTHHTETLLHVKIIEDQNTFQIMEEN